MYYNAYSFSKLMSATPTANSRVASLHRAAQMRDGDFLLFLGKRVRDLRNLRGMTRKLVARKADVSERHLAQLEAGEGNVSIVLLRRIAAALSTSLFELFAPEVDEPAEKQMIQRFLERLPNHRLEDVVFRLMRDFSPGEKVRRKRIALIGLRGAGKSTLGSKLAGDMTIPFIELDGEIEKRTLARVLNQHSCAVLSVGGGVVSEKETFDYLLSRCYTVWIKAQPEEYMARVLDQRDFRAMAGNNQSMEDLRRILDAREPLYRQADMELDTSGSSVEESFLRLKTTLQSNLQ